MTASNEQERPSATERVFPKEVHNLLVVAESSQMQLSAMADSKASMLMGACFVVFSISIGRMVEGDVSLPLVLLTVFSFAATLLGILTVRPARMKPRSIAPERSNIMFFGSFTNLSRAEYVEQTIHVLSSEEDVYRSMAGHIYDHGCELRSGKFRWLYWSFTLFMVGMVVTFAAVIFEALR
jgi:hypothetical protein